MPNSLTITRRPVSISIPQGRLVGELLLPEGPLGTVIFAHGSGSSADSPRNRYVAEQLAESGLASLLFDLLTIDEADDRPCVFDIELLARRLVVATDWVSAQREIAQLPVGYFGASTGAAAALVASTRSPRPIAAVVSRGGRPDLAGDALRKITAPTLLIVGGNDVEVLQLNRTALFRIPGLKKKLVIIPGATHIFIEPGTLEEVTRQATNWFSHHFTRALNSE